ncbi:MAG: dihydroneopterin aldolase [Microthrixaceae bacterium]
MSDRDSIELKGLSVTAVVGVLPEERDRAQPLNVDLELEVDLTAAGLSDSLDDTVDYGAVCDRVVEVVQRAEPLLLERLAALVADAVLALDGRVVSITVAISKLRPPVPHPLDSSGVRIIRRSRTT